jgi:hypothetical protein
MSQGAPTLLIEKLQAVAIDIEAIERLIDSEPPETSDQLLALRTIQELYRRLADDLHVAIFPLRVVRKHYDRLQCRDRVPCLAATEHFFTGKERDTESELDYRNGDSPKARFAIASTKKTSTNSRSSTGSLRSMPPA